MLDSIIYSVGNFLFKRKLKSLVKEAERNKSVQSIQLVWELIDPKYFLDIGLNHGNKLIINVNHKSIERLIDSMEMFYGLTQKEYQTLNFPKPEIKYKVTLLDFYLTEDDKIINLLDSLDIIKDYYIQISNFIMDMEGDVKIGYYLRKLESINEDLIQLSKALAIFKNNT